MVTMRINKESNPKNRKSVMVIGGDGYIGTSLVKCLKSADLSVWSYDKERGSRGEDFTDVVGHDAVVLLAAFPGIIACRGNMRKAVVNNISVAFNIMNQAAKDHVPVIFTSSQAAKEPFDNFYATIKKIIEIEALRLNQRKNADNRILRLTNVYGGENYLEKKNTVVKQFVMARQNRIKMVINGSGHQIRDFIHVNDVCTAIYKCIMHDERIPEPIDIGTGIGVSVLNLAEMFGTAFSFCGDSDTVGSDVSVADTTKAKEILDFYATEKLSDYIKNVEI